jgi:hypothetical protein
MPLLQPGRTKRARMWIYRGDVIGRLKTGHGWALQNRPVTVR